MSRFVMGMTNFSMRGKFRKKRVGAGGYSSDPIPIFSSSLLSTLVPQIYTGSSTPTFTRATTARVLDWEGLLKPVLSGESRFTGARRVQNFAPSSDGSGTWSFNTLTTSGGKTDPLGGTTAFRLTATAASNNVMYCSVPYPSGLSTSTVTWSAWIKRVIGTGNVRLALDSGNVSATLSLTTSWQRFSVTGLGGVGNCGFDIYVDTNGDAVDVAFMLGEEVVGQSNTNPSEFVSRGVLSAPYHGAGVDGVKYFTTLNGNTVSSNVVTEATGAAIKPANGSSSTTTDASGPFGYLSEAAATNLYLQSKGIGVTAPNAITATPPPNPTVTSNFSAGPDGTTTASKIVFPAVAGGSSYCIAYQAINVSAATYTFSMYLKGDVGGEQIYIQGTDGGGAGGAYIRKRVTLTTSWVLYEVTGTATATTWYWSVGVDLRDSSQTSIAALTLYAADGQLELGSVATSRIPTTTVAVTRNADALSYVSTSNALSAAGTSVADVRLSALGTLPTVYGFTTAAATYINSGTWTCYDGTGNFAFNAGTSNTSQRIGLSWGTGRSGSLNGSAATHTASYNGAMVDGATMKVGQAIGGAGNLGGNIRNFKIYGTQFTDAALAVLTT